MYSFLSDILIIVGFMLIGGGVKYIDDSFDRSVFSKKVSVFVGVGITILALVFSVLDPFLATILFSVLLSVILSGKVDNWLFIVCGLFFTCFLLLSSIVTLLWLPLIFLVGAGVLDEKLNDYADRHRVGKMKKFFLIHRFAMKASIFGLSIFSVFPWLCFSALLCFDIGYDVIGYFGEKNEKANEKA